MSYDTWEWDQVSGSGMISDFEAVRHDPIIRNEYESGYVQTAPQDVRGLWIFKLDFALLRPWSYIYLVNFHYAHRGGVPFYFRWPWGLADIPPEIETAAPGGVLPFDSEVVPGAGEGPTHLVFWDADEFPVKRLKFKNNFWQVNGSIQLRQV